MSKRGLADPYAGVRQRSAVNVTDQLRTGIRCWKTCFPLPGKHQSDEEIVSGSRRAKGRIGNQKISIFIMKEYLLMLLFSALLYTGRGQAPAIALEDWSKVPTLHRIDSRYDKESAVILLDKRRMEYVDDAKNQIGLYRTLHRIVRVNDDNGIESFNRIYLGVTDNADIIDIRRERSCPGVR